MFKSKIRIVLSLLLVVFLCFQFLTYSGVCYRERRWLSNDEIVQRYLEQRKKWIPQIIVSEDPNDPFNVNAEGCCIVSENRESNFSDVFFFNIIGSKFLIISDYLKVHASESLHFLKSEPYYEMKIFTNACGTKFFDWSASHIGEGEFNISFKTAREKK